MRKGCEEEDLTPFFARDGGEVEAILRDLWKKGVGTFCCLIEDPLLEFIYNGWIFLGGMTSTGTAEGMGAVEDGWLLIFGNADDKEMAACGGNVRERLEGFFCILGYLSFR